MDIPEIHRRVGKLRMVSVCFHLEVVSVCQGRKVVFEDKYAEEEWGELRDNDRRE